MGALLSLALCLPQIVPAAAEAVLVSGGLERGPLRLHLSALALGGGGVGPGSEKATAGQVGQAEQRGRIQTPGGVLVRAQAEGVKLDFHSGHELLVTPSGRIHLRSGEQTLAFTNGLRLLLADGSMVTARRSPGGRRPLASVEVEANGRTRRIWNRSARVANASHVGGFPGPAVVVLGDGRVLYQVAVAGPLLGLRRVLCPKELQPDYPLRRLYVLGDVLAQSLRRLPAHAPRKSVQFPQTLEAAQEFARLSPVVFPARNIPRPPGAVGQLWFELPQGFQLKVEVADKAPVVLGLYRTGSDVPGVEWQVGARTTIHFVRPGGGMQGGPRYFMKGLDLKDLVSDLLPVQSTPRQRTSIRELIVELGGRTPKKLEIKRQ